MARKVTTVLSLRDNYTAVIQKARRYTSAFQKDVQNMIGNIDKAAAHVSSFKNQLKPAENAIKKLVGKDWTVNLKIKDGATAAISKIGPAFQKMRKMAGSVGNAVFSAGSRSINKGLGQEGCDLSAGQFAGITNLYACKDKIYKKASNRLNLLRKSTAETSIKTGGVIQVGTKDVQITQGHTHAEQSLVKMAGNSTGLVPGKMILSTMTARADTQAEEFYKKGSAGKTLLAVFDSGAEELAKTTANMISVITGELKSKITNIGLQFVQEMLPFLQWVRDTVLPDIEKFLFTPSKDTGKTGVQVITEALQSVYYWLRDQLPSALDTIRNAWESLNTAMSDPNSALNRIISSFGNNLSPADTGEGPAKDKNVDNFWPTLSNIANTLTVLDYLRKGINILKDSGNLLPKIQEIAISMWAAIKSYWEGTKAAAVGVGAAVAAGWAGLASGVQALFNSPEAFNLANGAGNFLAAGGGTFSAAFGTWMENQMRAASFDYTQTTGQQADISNMGDWLKVFAWKNVEINKQIDQNVDSWGNDFNTLMDNFFGIKRHPSGLIDLGASFRRTQPDMSKFIAFQVSGTQAILPTTDAISSASTIWPVPESSSKNVENVAEVIKTTPNNGWGGVGDIFTGIGDAAGFAASQVSVLSGMMGGGISSGMMGGGGVNVDHIHAAGIKRVPFDNYPALLHKGEAVLPSGEAGEYRRQGNMAGRAANNISLNISVNGGGMDENRLASILVNKLQEVALNMA